MEDRSSPIRRLLDERGIKYQHFAKRVGITPVAFTRIESGIQKPPPDYYVKAALFLNVDEERVLPSEAVA